MSEKIIKSISMLMLSCPGSYNILAIMNTISCWVQMMPRQKETLLKSHLQCYFLCKGIKIRESRRGKMLASYAGIFCAVKREKGRPESGIKAGGGCSYVESRAPAPPD